LALVWVEELEMLSSLDSLDRLGTTTVLEDSLIKDVCKLLWELGHEVMAERLMGLVRRVDGEITYLEDSLETRDSDVEALKEEICELREELERKVERIDFLEEEVDEVRAGRELREGRDGG
jgi:predicted RNase H-like nuclease (RuvC/YqgF family)